MGPLTGITVVESAMFLNGPVAGYMLGDLGAEIIKVEPPVTGDLCRGMNTLYDVQMTLPDGRNAIYESANRNKKSIILDLRNEKGRGILYQLVEKSDVFLTNYRPSAIRKLKIDYGTLSQYNSKLIYATASAYGSKGPLRDTRGWDIAAQAVSGAMWIVGDRDSAEPSVTVGAVFDQFGGSMLAYGILAALVHRERTGMGQEVQCSLLGSAIHMQAVNINPFLLRGRGMARFSRKRCRNPLTNYYQCSDGKWILLSEPQSDRYWHDFCAAIGIQELEKDPRFSTAEAKRENYTEFIAILDRRFASKPRDEWVRVFEQHDFAYAPVYDYEDVTNEPQVLANEYVVEMDHAALGKVRTVGSPVWFSKTPVSIRCGSPEFGQHTEEVLREVLNYSWEEISILRNQGAFGLE